MSVYTLDIDIGEKDYKELKQGNYTLCVAKKVNGKFNVVWQGIDFLLFNTVEWEEKYKVYAQNAFKNGALVKASTKQVGIKYGQTSTLDKLGQMGNATGPVDTSGTFHVQNDFRQVSIGVSAFVGDDWSPIFAGEPVVTGLVDLSPIVEVMVWFSSSYKTGTMFSKSITNATTVEYEGTTTHTISYNNGGWILGNNLVVGKTYDPVTNTFSFDTLPTTDQLKEQASLVTSLGVKPAIDWLFSSIITFTNSLAANAAQNYLKSNQKSDWSVDFSGRIPGESQVKVKVGWIKKPEAKAAGDTNQANGDASADIEKTHSFLTDLTELQHEFASLINAVPEQYTTLTYNFENLN